MRVVDRRPSTNSPRLYFMRLLAAILVTAVTGAAASALDAQTPSPSQADIARARRVLSTTPLIDGHNDLPWVIRESKTAPRDEL